MEIALDLLHWLAPVEQAHLPKQEGGIVESFSWIGWKYYGYWYRSHNRRPSWIVWESDELAGRANRRIFARLFAAMLVLQNQALEFCSSTDRITRGTQST
jgi:hypothetical protein